MIHTSNRGPISRIYKEFLQNNEEKEKHPVIKMGKILNSASQKRIFKWSISI